MTEPIFRLENVSYTYPDGPMAVENLNISIHAGERVAVLGRNGAGKSTFFLLCNGVLEPESGTIYCAGQAVSRKKKDPKYCLFTAGSCLSHSSAGLTPHSL